jgi:hypothetical protein
MRSPPTNERAFWRIAIQRKIPVAISPIGMAPPGDERWQRLLDDAMWKTHEDVIKQQSIFQESRERVDLGGSHSVARSDGSSNSEEVRQRDDKCGSRIKGSFPGRELGKSEAGAAASMATEVLSKEEALRRLMLRKAARGAAGHPVMETAEQVAAKREWWWCATLNQLIAKQGLKRNSALERFMARKGLKLGSSPSCPSAASLLSVQLHFPPVEHSLSHANGTFNCDRHSS